MKRFLVGGVDDTDDSRNALARAAKLAPAHALMAQLTERAGFALVRHTQVRVW